MSDDIHDYLDGKAPLPEYLSAPDDISKTWIIDRDKLRESESRMSQSTPTIDSADVPVLSDVVHLPEEWIEARSHIIRRLHVHGERIERIERQGAETASKLDAGLAEVGALRGEVRAVATGINAVLALTRNQASAAEAERRLNGATYQRLHALMDEDAVKRSAYYANDELRLRIERSRLVWARAIFWSLVALVLAVITSGAKWHGAETVPETGMQRRGENDMDRRRGHIRPTPPETEGGVPQVWRPRA